jgi:nucleotide-binding universal stress UspA family protein
MTPYNFANVLVAIDGSEDARKALDCALSLCEVLGARLTALAVEGKLPAYAVQRRWISRIEGGGAPRADVLRRPLELLGIPAGEDGVGALAAGEVGRLEADPGPAADQNNGLPEQLRLAVNGSTGGRGRHGHNVASRCVAPAR